MNKMKIFTVISLILFLTSCQSFSLKQDKNQEFLVEKKSPLIMPPDYNELPEPGKLPEKQQSEEENLKKIIKGSKIKSQSGSRGKSSVEKSILDKIKN